MKRRNLRAPFIIGILIGSFLVVVGVIAKLGLVANIGGVVDALVLIWAAWALTFGKHTELLAGASGPVVLGKGATLLVWLLGAVLLVAGIYILATIWLGR